MMPHYSAAKDTKMVKSLNSNACAVSIGQQSYCLNGCHYVRHYYVMAICLCAFTCNASYCKQANVLFFSKLHNSNADTENYNIKVCNCQLVRPLWILKELNTNWELNAVKLIKQLVVQVVQ